MNLDPNPAGLVAHRRRRLLLSAFACCPDWGSEPGVGWNWAISLASRYDVTVVTHVRFQARIEAEINARPQPGLTFLYVGLPGCGGDLQRQVDSRGYYWRWQWALRAHVVRLLAERPHDLIHHLTWGSCRLPSFLGGLGVPFALGPIGGGDDAPPRLYRSWPWREKVLWRLRSAAIALVRLDPFMRRTLAAACCVLVRTAATRDALPGFASSRATLALEIGIAALPAPTPRDPSRPGPLRLLYAGRLIGGKGISYAVDAVIALRQRGLDVQLTVAGSGRMEAWLQARLARSGLQTAVKFLGWVAREDMPALYRQSDLFVFPSWFDSSGTVVIEALANGLPVLCLDIGGARHTADADSAVWVRTAGLDEAGLVASIANQIARLDADRPALSRLADGAYRRAGELGWRRQVDLAYQQIEARLGWTPSGACAGGSPISSEAAL